MGEIMTMEEIKARFDSEWVFIEDPETTEALEVIRGKVLWHSKDRDEVWRKVTEVKPRYAAVFYIGSLPKGMEYIL